MQADLIAQLQVPKSLSLFVNAILDKPDRIRRLADLCAKMKDRVDARELNQFALNVRRLAPNDSVVVNRTAKVLNPAFSAVHFACLNDHNRNKAFEAALNNTITPESVVLDIGAGSGILSMMAARAGAKHVYAVEIEPMVVDAAREIIKLNGYEDKITVIEKDIQSVEIGKDIPERCNIAIQDIIYDHPLAHDIHKYLSYAKTHLLLEDSIIFPSSVELRAALSGADKYIRHQDYKNIAGFDFSPMTVFEPSWANFSQDNVAEELLTDNFAMWTFDLTQPMDLGDFQNQLDVNILQSGDIHHVFRWVKIYFPDGSSYEDGFESRMTCRAFVAYKVLDPIPVKQNQTINIRIESIDNQIFTSVGLKS